MAWAGPSSNLPLPQVVDHRLLYPATAMVPLFRLALASGFRDGFCDDVYKSSLNDPYDIQNYPKPSCCLLSSPHTENEKFLLMVFLMKMDALLQSYTFLAFIFSSTDRHPNLMWTSWLLNLREYNPVKTTKARLDNFTVATLVNLYIKIKQTSNLIYF